MFEIISLKPGDKNFYLFENFPKEIYEKDSPHFYLQEKINNEYLKECFVLLVNGKVKSRCALYDNPYLFYQNKKAACIGNFESVNNEEIAAELLTHVSSNAKKLGAQFLIGPMNGSTWNDYRFSVHHNQPPFFLEPWHHLYYHDQFIKNGFAIIGKYFSSIETDLAFHNPQVVEKERQLKQSGVTFRNISLVEFEAELEKLFCFNAIAFQSNFLYTPINKDAFIKKYEETISIINPAFVIIAEDDKKNLVGYIFCVDDFFNKKEKSLILKTVARHPDKKWSGTGHVLGKMICEKAIDNNYKSIIHSFMYEEGTSNKMSKTFSGNIFKYYVLYGKDL